MASIEIFELRPIGVELFEDCETFLNNLIDDDINLVKGGHLSYHHRRFLREDQRPYNQGNSVNNNTYVGHSINAVSYSNGNTIAGV